MIKIISEPCGKTYRSLIEYAEQQCSFFSLVWPVNMEIYDSANQIQQKLFDFMESEIEIKSEWKAVGVEDEKFPIKRKFVINPKSIAVLKDSPKLFACPERENKVSWRIEVNREPGLYSWITPALPEDLTFYTSAGDIWMTSTSHEEEANFNESIVNPDEIKKNLPELKIETT